MSGATRADVYKLLGFIQDDLRQTQAKLVEVRSMLAAGAMSREPADLIGCPHCGVQLASTRVLASHLANVHDGPPVPLTETEEAA
jgi:hypothetical protein